MKSVSRTADNSNSEANVVLRAQRGDAEAFASLFNAHKSKVYSICLRMTSNTAEAEDLTQDVFLHVFRKLATFRQASAFSTWLYRVTVNTVLMHFRKKKVCQLSLDEPVNSASGARTRQYGKNDDELVGVVDRIALTRAMTELPEGYRSVFVLHEVKGYEHHDIARLLRCSIGTSKSQLHKAKARTRELLGLGKPRRPFGPVPLKATGTQPAWAAPNSINKENSEPDDEAAAGRARLLAFNTLRPKHAA